ncbi:MULTISPECIES: RepB family plasmid replication initiator protein [unclassified Lactococcus]|uniref:RepB family plasmid replication initiator protein n=1 Tax=unclassified Lactococcus TaxID=2643510 RepID=UPI0014315797|nr:MULTISPECIES: RepB family plasmid replication initiator protein [unclassified Lactococcus]KAF6605666.1 RepB family plasmid replication initiator protein [Lactococcus sp. EKM201L]KAF6610804.1 RepB family plasmid replication initiator protein [Lactococcus sp. EKM203L]KAF6639840.1 RepB family plasmid replication initiator protein [Lactococcus sp. EKM501L]KAF6641002.1 RepB family plasmid replication initiator protein [Lactococcus sp. EKM502L]KAF6650479.1 RepB family plasmid replication initiato
MSSIPEKQENQKQVLTLNELSKRKVVEHNSLITSIAKMDKTPLKMFELAVSCINTEEPPKDNIVYLSKRDLFAFFKVSDNDKHSRFKEAIEKMQKQAFFQIKEEAGKGFKFKSIVPIPYVEWTDYHDEVKIEFHREIMPYLINLKKNFTQHALSDLAELNSKYSIILYRWLSMNYNQYEHYSAKGGRRAEQVESYRNPSISIKELRIMTDTVNDYERFQSLETWILKKPLEEINAHTSFNVTYDKIKKGRSIDSIVFHIEKKRCADDNSYKLNDKMYQAEQAKKEETEDRLAIEAMKNKYTKLLLDNMLLNSYEMTDTAIMAGLQQHVYPLYDELKDLHGMKAVQDHLSYVASKQEAYSKRNIAKYLKKAIEQYLPTVRGSDIENMADLLKKIEGKA